MFDVEEVEAAPRLRFEGDAFRHQAPHYDPRLGDGARRRGGRHNPPGSFPTLYLCRTRACAAAELRREGGRRTIGLEGLLPRVLHRYRIELDGVLDLTDDAVLGRLHVSRPDLVDRQWAVTQRLGAVVHDLGRPGLLAPSATGVDAVLVVFLDNVGSGRVEPSLAERWESSADL